MATTNEIERKVEVATLSDRELVVLFTDATLEVWRRKHQLRGLSFKDSTGATWSMHALARKLGFYFAGLEKHFGRSL